MSTAKPQTQPKFSLGDQVWIIHEEHYMAPFRDMYWLRHSTVAYIEKQKLDSLFPDEEPRGWRYFIYGTDHSYHEEQLFVEYDDAEKRLYEKVKAKQDRDKKMREQYLERVKAEESAAKKRKRFWEAS